MKKLTLLLALSFSSSLYPMENDGEIKLVWSFQKTLTICTEELKKMSHTLQETLNKSSEPTIITGIEARKTIKTAGLMLSGTGMFCMSSWLVFDGIKKYSHKHPSENKTISSDNNKTEWHPAGKQIFAGIIGIMASVCLIGYSETLIDFFSKKISQEAV